MSTSPTYLQQTCKTCTNHRAQYPPTLPSVTSPC
ncbi:hypothetical protein M3J09_012062 [Ascochyta lentis]